MKNWKPVDILVGLLVFGVTVILLVTGFLPFMLNKPLDDVENLEAKFAMLGGIVSIISMYVGARLRSNGGDEDE